MAREIASDKFPKLEGIDWPTFDVLVGGKSSIDLNSLNLKNAEEVKMFLRTYGHDPADKGDQRQAHAMLIESIRFIEHRLLPREWNRGLRPPEEILNCESPVELVKFVALGERDAKAKWACGILKVMHTIAHMKTSIDSLDMDQVRQQIMGKFQSLLERDSDGQLWLKGKQRRVKVDKVDWKVIKDRNSILLKLIHKPGNVAETIYDIFGVLIIVENHADVVKLLNLIVSESIVSFPNSFPGRARNTLIDLAKLKTDLEGLNQMLEKGELSEDEYDKQIDLLDIPVLSKNSANPHSLKSYRSLQMTCRQLVSYSDPKLGWIQKINRQIERDSIKDKELASTLKKLAKFATDWHDGLDDEVKLYFPYEIQVFDRTAAKIAFEGEASHKLYKQSQVRTARRRVLSEILAK